MLCRSLLEPTLQVGKLRHTETLAVFPKPRSGLNHKQAFPQQVSRAGRAQAAGWAGVACPQGADMPAVTSLCWHAVLGSRSDASREPEPQHPM